MAARSPKVSDSPMMVDAGSAAAHGTKTGRTDLCAAAALPIARGQDAPALARARSRTDLCADGPPPLSALPRTRSRTPPPPSHLPHSASAPARSDLPGTPAPARSEADAQRQARNNQWLATQPTEADLDAWARQGWRRIDLWQCPEAYVQMSTTLRIRSNQYGWFETVAGQNGWSWIQYAHRVADDDDRVGMKEEFFLTLQFLYF